MILCHISQYLILLLYVLFFLFFLLFCFVSGRQGHRHEKRGAHGVVASSHSPAHQVTYQVTYQVTLL